MEMVDLAPRKDSKTKLNINAPVFIPTFSTNDISTVRRQPTDSRNEDVGEKVMSYSAALKSVKPKPKPPVAIASPQQPSNGSQPLSDEIDHKAAFADKEPGFPTPAKQTPPKSKHKPSKSVPLADFIMMKITPDMTNPPKDAAKITAVPVTQNGIAAKARTTMPKGAHKDEKHSAAVPRGNVLDSTAPVLHKGKQRENPKKKYSKMKKVILHERLQHRQKNDSQGEVPEGSQTEALQEGEPPEVEATQTEPVQENEHPEVVTDSKDSSSVMSAGNAVPVAAKSNTPRKKFSKFCDNVLSAELDEHVKAVIHELGRFQDRLHAADPNKARMKKRLVYGLREVHKLLKVEKVKCVIFAPNIEAASGQGGLDEMVADILNMCRQQSVPYFFAMSKMKLGFISHKHTPVSCAGILNYQGADVQYKALLETVAKAKEDFVSKDIIVSSD